MESEEIIGVHGSISLNETWERGNAAFEIPVTSLILIQAGLEIAKRGLKP